MQGGDTNIKVIDWLFRVENEFRLRRIPENLKISYILAFVKRYFFELARRYIDSNNQDWNSFKAEVLLKTDSEEINFNLKKKLFALKQDTSFDKF